MPVLVACSLRAVAHGLPPVRVLVVAMRLTGQLRLSDRLGVEIFMAYPALAELRLRLHEMVPGFPLNIIVFAHSVSVLKAFRLV
jgi:hypothetical protein